MSIPTNQQLWDKAITAFPYPLQTQTDTRGEITVETEDFSYVVEYLTPIAKVFEDEIIARVRVFASREGTYCRIRADIDMYLNNVHSDNFLQYGSWQGHNGIYQQKSDTWVIMITD